LPNALHHGQAWETFTLLQVTFPEPTDPKARLRSAMRHLMRENPADSARLHPVLDSWLAAHPALQTIAVFSALPGEVDLTEITVRHPERCWAWPRVDGNDLHFHQAENAAALPVTGSFGIREPSPEMPVVPVERIDAFFCPGLAFDVHGGRLGRGRGFYDRMLSRARPDALRIGVCFPWQMVQDTFSEAHDVMMDEVLSAVAAPDAAQ
jgi:5-formyltetrahydrofolate cyclo-ligase